MQKPTKGSLLQRGHPLARGIILCSLINTGTGDKIYDLSGNEHHGSFSSASWGAQDKGRVVVHDNINDRVDFGDASLILPTQEISIALGYRKRDGTNRASGAFGVAAGAPANIRCGVHLPFTDGTVYWDFGGSAEDTTRESVSGLSFGNDNWVFTSGPNGMEIWQNGILRSFNTANPTRSSSSEFYKLGTHGGSVSDIAEYSYFYIYNRQLQEAEIVQLNLNPYQIFTSDLTPEIFGTIAVVSGNPWYAYAQQ